MEKQINKHKIFVELWVHNLILWDPLLAMIINSVVQLSTRTLFTELNNAWFHQTHSLIIKPYLVIIASNVWRNKKEKDFYD